MLPPELRRFRDVAQADDPLARARSSRLMRDRLRVPLSLVVLISLSAPGVVSADALRVRDPNDVRGRLDIRAVAHGHGSRKGSVTHRVSVHRAFGSRLLETNGAVELMFSGRPGGCESVAIMIDAVNGGLRARIRFVDPLGCGRYDDSGGSSMWEPLDAVLTRPDRRTVKIELQRTLLPGRGDYGWYAETRFWRNGTGCGQRCVDQAPDEGYPRGRIAHDP